MRKPYFVRSRKAWYVWHHGTQIRLGISEEEAYQRWEQLRATECTDVTTPVVVVLDRFLDWVHRNRALRTYEWYHRHLEPFARHIGKKLATTNLKPFHVTQFIDHRHNSSAPDTVHGNIRAIQRAFNWAVAEGYLVRSPVAFVQKPRPRRREVLISNAEFEAILELASDQPEKDLLTILWETGCRPNEVRIVAAKHFDDAHARWVIPRLDAKGKQHPRVVYLNDNALDVTRRLASQYPTGPIFRNAQGRPWTRNAIKCRFRKYKQFDIPGLCATAFRHSWTTHALKRGVDAVSVSLLLGHRDTSMISRYYSHLAQNPEFLRTQATKATR